MGRAAILLGSKGGSRVASAPNDAVIPRTTSRSVNKNPMPSPEVIVYQAAIADRLRIREQITEA